jgi:mycofactocin system transcriptional regulator
VTQSNGSPKGPYASSRAAVEKVALELFAERGFDDTPVEDIAAAAGISRRTFFRYFPTKSDVLFGEFGMLLDALVEWFAEQPDDAPMFEVIAEATMRFNRVHTDGPVAHRERMELILHTPALRANAALRHAEWLAVIAEYAARRTDEPIGALGPQLAAHLSIGAANAAYEQWLADPKSDLGQLVRRAFGMIELRPAEVAPTRPARKRRSSVAN